MKPKQPEKSKKAGGHTAPRANPPRRTSPSENLHGKISTRAYELYERRVCQGALDDWLQAEQEILGQEKTGKADPPHRGGYAGEEQE